MKAVLISIQPKWVEKIVNGQKTIEVRKTAPKCDAPFKGYIYCTKSTRAHMFHLYINGGIGRQKFGITGHWRSGKKVVEVNPHLPAYRYNSYLAEGKVIGEFVCDKVDKIWHISDLKIYDKPKELIEFRVPCPTSCENCKNPLYYECWCEEKGIKVVTRAPQSWQYVEEL